MNWILTFCKFIFQLSISNGFCCLTHLSKQFFQAPHTTNYAAWMEKQITYKMDIIRNSRIFVKRQGIRTSEDKLVLWGTFCKVNKLANLTNCQLDVRKTTKKGLIPTFD